MVPNCFFKLAARGNINLNIAADLSRYLVDAGFTLLKHERKEPRFTEVIKQDSLHDNFLKWYIMTTSAVPSNAYKLGLISDQEWRRFQAGVERGALNLQENATLPVVMIVAQVMSVRLFQRYMLRNIDTFFQKPTL